MTPDTGNDVGHSVIGSSLSTRAAETRFSHERLKQTRYLVQIEQKLLRSCERVVLLNDKIRGLSSRYQQARSANIKSFRYNIRIRLAVVEGVRNMYYEYARDRAEEVAELRKALYNQNVQIVTASDGEDDDSDVDDDVSVLVMSDVSGDDDDESDGLVDLSSDDDLDSDSSDDDSEDDSDVDHDQHDASTSVVKPTETETDS